MVDRAKAEAAREALRELANVKMEISVEDWCRISNTILSALATPEAEPVGYPRILYVCEYCQENNPEMCGRDRDDLYVTPDGRWLCDSCLDEEGIPSSDCVSPPTLYTHPSPPITDAGVEAAQAVLNERIFDDGGVTNAEIPGMIRDMLTAFLKARRQG